MSKPEKKQTERVAFLADRMAILLVICKSRTGDWNPWFREGMYEGPTGEEIRGWPDYQTAKDIIREMLRRHDNESG